MEARWDVCYTDLLPHPINYKIVENIVRQEDHVIFVGHGSDGKPKMRHGETTLELEPGWTILLFVSL